MGCGDDAAEIEGQQCDGRRRQHARDDRAAADGGDPTRERVLQLGPGCARVAPDEDPAAAGPDRRGTAETFDEIRGYLFADDATDPVRAEVLARQLALPLAELWRLARLVQARLLALDDPSVARQEAGPLERDAQLGSASTSARAMP